MYKIVHLNNEVAIAQGLIGKRTRFGWIVSGLFTPKTSSVHVLHVQPICCATALTGPAKDVERLWTLEAIGLPDSPKQELKASELDAVRQFKKGVSYDGRAYTVTVPKRDSIIQLANNLEVAWNRLAAKRRSKSASHSRSF